MFSSSTNSTWDIHPIITTGSKSTNQPKYVQQFKIPVVDEQALDKFATNLTATRVLVEQSSVHNTPIYMVAKRGGANVGKK